MENAHDEKPLRRVLVVDDEPEIAALFAEILGSDGWKTDTAASGAQAIELFRRNQYDLITLDCQMPDLTGPDLHRILSQTYGYGKRVTSVLPPLLPPVLVVSAWFHEDACQRLIFGERVAGILQKPVTSRKLIETAHDLWVWDEERRQRRARTLARLGARVLGVSA